MFKFKFANDESEDHILGTKDEKVWKDSKEIIFDKDNKVIQGLADNVEPGIAKYNNSDIKYINSSRVVEVLRNLGNTDELSALKADQNHSDLLPALYEGGLKIWECTFDVLRYLEHAELNFNNKKVLDLGCGAGIIGMSMLLGGAQCWFQDYNEEVIQYITIPNVLLNNKELINKCKFFCGDWGSFSNQVQNIFVTDDDKFDFIFTSETIYNAESYPKLHQVFEKLLKRTGVIFLAAKLFYFGVGGGVSLFQDFLKQHKVFKYFTCWENTEGVKRAIVKLEFNT